MNTQIWWILQLNDMRGRFENLQAVARAESPEALHAFLAAERVESYVEEDVSNYGPARLRKAFRKGGPLEYFNPPDRPECFIRVSLDDWIQGTIRQFENQVMGIPKVP